METVSVTREIDAPPTAVEEAMADVEAFMRAGGFDEVVVEGDAVEIEKVLGLARLHLSLAIVDDPDAALALDQREGVFEELSMRYAVEPADGGSRVTATTEFALGGVVGSVMESTFVRRQRAKEIDAQMDYLEAAASR